MKRSKIGALLLLALLVIGMISSWAMVRLTEPLGQTMETAAAAALRQDWAAAEVMAGSARSRWKAYWNLCAAFSDHAPMETINELFAQLDIYTKSRDSQNFAAICALLSETTKAIGEAHSLTWWNLL